MSCYFYNVTCLNTCAPSPCTAGWHQSFFKQNLMEVAQKTTIHFAPYFLCCLVEAFPCSICKCPGFVLGYLSGTKQVLHNSKLIRTKAFPNATNEFWSTFFLLFKLSSLLLKMYLKTKLQGTSCCIIYPAFLYSSKYWFQSTFGKRRVFQ